MIPIVPAASGRRDIAVPGLTTSWLTVIASLAIFCGCERRPGASGEKKAQLPPANVCDLLLPAEIEPLIGASITNQNSSRRPSGAVVISQCVYVANEASKSVSLVLTQANPTGRAKDSAVEAWDKSFGRFSKKEPEREEAEKERERPPGREEEEREARPPRAIEGLGEEAYWTAGSLYVRQHDLFFRLSPGGAESEERKLEISKELANRALKRL